jgi:hypothetical protein
MKKAYYQSFVEFLNYLFTNMSTNTRATQSSSVLKKRTFSQAFEDDKEEEHYGQKIDEKFFETNIGHSVSQPATFADFRLNFGKRDCEGKYNVDEIIEWCDFYSKNRNLFNV